jgi:hypothetical protein
MRGLGNKRHRASDAEETEDGQRTMIALQRRLKATKARRRTRKKALRRTRTKARRTRTKARRTRTKTRRTRTNAPRRSTRAPVETMPRRKCDQVCRLMGERHCSDQACLLMCERHCSVVRLSAIHFTFAIHETYHCCLHFAHQLTMKGTSSIESSFI